MQSMLAALALRCAFQLIMDLALAQALEDLASMRRKISHLLTCVRGGRETSESGSCSVSCILLVYVLLVQSWV